MKKEYNTIYSLAIQLDRQSKEFDNSLLKLNDSKLRNILIDAHYPIGATLNAFEGDLSPVERFQRGNWELLFYGNLCDDYGHEIPIQRWKRIA